MGVQSVSKKELKDYRLTKRVAIYAVEAIILIFLIIMSLGSGSVNYSAKEILMALSGQGDSVSRVIVREIRIPRTVSAILVGSNIAIAGALLQAVLKNPLAAPGIIGVTSGASLAAVTIMLVFPALTYFVPFAAFFGGILATFLVFALAWKKGTGVNAVRIVLAGVALNAILGGGTSLLSILYSDRIQGILMWVNGSLAGNTWIDVQTLLPYTVVGFIVALFLSDIANLLQLGDSNAVSLGVKLNQARIILSITAAFLTGISVAIAGIIGFVGLIIPHISRLLVGSNYRFLIPSCALLGASLLVLADMVARTIFAPIELPVGLIMAVSGGPFFLYLLKKVGREGY
ncbi:iron ABC transporter permease [Thermosipho ferrireducens]|uniref:Iron ABC transporter permease n=1 Tax=Thermosipho ferrireducens TaxID=2571116 RepID=A0ABX7S8T3_9BACT|nr:iron ABC transporter permease [Thermosipho ferrireducens]QTA37530.1 iron ABC transporter permease [Thermosipho ferrireducens]